MPISQTSFNNITVGYISETDGYVQNVSLADANAYAELNPETEFIFICLLYTSPSPRDS